MPKPFRFSASLGNIAPDQIAATAQRAEELGYSAVTTPDHLDDQPAPLLALTSAALATTRLRVLPLVLANDYRNPVILAKELATLDAISGGRLDLGIGAGWMTADYEFSGITNDRPGARITRLSESVEILTALLRGESVDHTSDHYTVSGTLSPPLPVQAGGIPLMLAGGREKMLTLAGAKADIVGINPGLTAGVIDERAGRDATADQTDRKLGWVRNGAGPRFDDIELQTRVHLAMIDDDREAVAEAMAPLLGMSSEEALASPHALVGTITQCTDTVRSWRDRWGISFVSIDAEVMEDFAPVIEALAGT
jgi:probable F420-dependent oxidoreductase